MAFDDDIKRIMEESFSSDNVDKVLKERFDKALADAVDSALSWGKARDALKEKVNSILVPFVEGYDLSDYTLKLGVILDEIVQNSSLADNKSILENFKFLMCEPKQKKVNLSDLFEEYKEFVAEYVDTSGREVEVSDCWDDGPDYVPIDVEMEFEEGVNRSWSYFEQATVVFSVGEEEQEEELNRLISLSRWKSDPEGEWRIECKAEPSVFALQHMKPFDIMMLRLSRARTKVIIDVTSDDDEVTPDEKPEATFS